MTVNQRIVKIYKFLNISPAEFSRLVDVPHSRLNNQILGKNGVGLDTVQSIIKNIKNLNPAWLLIGEGDMWLSENLNIQHSDNLKLDEPEPKYEKPEKPTLIEKTELEEKRWELAMIEIEALRRRVELLEKESKRKK